MERKTLEIDVSGKSLGRVATQIAIVLQGKDKADYTPYKDEGDLVVIKNIEKIVFTGDKAEQKKYFSHSGYLGNDKLTPLKKIFARDPGEILKRAVWNMLPKNKLRDKRIKRLKV